MLGLVSHNTDSKDMDDVAWLNLFIQLTGIVADRDLRKDWLKPNYNGTPISTIFNFGLI